jgi:hypothetical protein
VAPWGGGLAGASLSSSPGHGETGLLGQNDARVDGVLTRDETRRGMTPRWLAAAAPLLRARMMVSGGSGALPGSRSSSMPSLWPPLASPCDGLARAVARQWHTVAARV